MIRGAAEAMERSPKTYAGMGEVITDLDRGVIFRFLVSPVRRDALAACRPAVSVSAASPSRYKE